MSEWSHRGRAGLPLRIIPSIPIETCETSKQLRGVRHFCGLFLGTGSRKLQRKLVDLLTR